MDINTSPKFNDLIIDESLAITPSNSLEKEKYRKRHRIILCIACVAVVGTIIGVYASQSNHESQYSNAFSVKLESTSLLRMTIMIKQDNSKINANIVPRKSSNGELQFDGELIFEINGLKNTYSFVQNKGYFTTSSLSGENISSRCLSKLELMPINELLASINKAKELDTAIMNCPQGKVIQITFAGEPYLICTDRSGKFRQIMGEDIDINLEYSSDHSKIVVPLSKNDSLPSCNALDVHQSGHLNVASLSLRSQERAFRQGSCSCKGEKKKCLFVHGVGRDEGGSVGSTFKDYWGEIHKHSPCCSSFHFMKLATSDNAWHGSELQNQVCNQALHLDGSVGGDKVVDNLIIVTHSMGGLILSSAIANKRCSLSRTTKWIALSVPMQGSKSADELLEKCSSDPGTWDKLIGRVLGWAGFCPIEDGFNSLVHQDGADASLRRKYEAAQAVYRRDTTFLLCAVSSYGLNSKYSAPLKLVGSISDHPTDEQDGVVDFFSCTAKSNKRFSNDWSDSTNYKAEINHLDSAFRNGDGWWGSARKPVKWFECLL